jgi:uncharacterized Zn-finger protein
MFAAKQFSVPVDLERHKRRKHTVDRPHECDVCNKRFLHPSDVTARKQLHTGEKHMNVMFARNDFQYPAI